MSWKVVYSKKVERLLKKLPTYAQEAFDELYVDLHLNGPYRGDWPNYSKLSDSKFHCHLNYSYVVVWVVLDLNEKTLEVTYVGSRENAPY